MNASMWKKSFPILLILVIAAFLRFFHLAQLPVILNRDEAALAYNALLVERSGYDEWHQHLPFIFRSFGDYKLPGYIYTLVLCFHFLPNTDFVTRLPSALAGCVLVYLAYLWSKNLGHLSQRWSYVFAFLIAVLPVFSFYSRIAFEANLALTFVVTALYLLLSQPKRWLWSSLCLLIAALTYNTPLLLMPFFVVLYLFLFWMKRDKNYVWAAVTTLIIFILVTWQLLPLTAQKSNITIFNDATVWTEYVQYRQELPHVLQPLIGSKYVYFAWRIIQNCAASFSPHFLVLKGGSHPWHNTPFWGHFFISSYVFALLAILWSVKQIFEYGKHRQWPIFSLTQLYLLLIGLAPSIVTVDSPHATRSLFFFFQFAFFSVLGMQQLYAFCQRRWQIKNIFWWGVIFIVIESCWYQYRYFQFYPHQQPTLLWPNYQILLAQAEAEHAKEKVAVVDPEGYQYIVTAWYLKLRPTLFFQSIEHQAPDLIQFSYGAEVSHYHFIRQAQDRSDETVIISQDRGLEIL